MPIRLLPSELVDQIAAGEVVERPASVVKELVENSLDAGATRIEVDIEAGGVGLVRVRDDGRGVDADELPLAVQRHATSKIATLDDLAAVRSLGFRGEALPSIGSIARLRLASRTAAAMRGAEVLVEGGAVAPVQPSAQPAGTLVEVRDLFYNVPARRKFVRTESTELSHVVRLVERFALSRFDVAFRLRSGSRVLLDVPVAATPEARRQRIATVMGEDFAASCLEVERQSGPVRLSGWIGQPEAARAQSDQQFFYVNGRTVRDRLLANAARLGYRDVLYHGRQPSYLLYLELDPELVDVNAHPQKLEVRFRDGRQIHDFVMRTLSRALGIPAGGLLPAGATAPHGAAARVAAGAGEGASGMRHWQAPAPGSLFASGVGSQDALLATAWAVAEIESKLATTGPQSALVEDGLGTAIAQLHGIYVLAQSTRGLVLVDAHAAHERVLYERMKREAGDAAASQALLEPVVVELKPHECDALETVRDDFVAAGFEFDALAPGRVAVRRVPAMLGQADVATVVRDVVRDVLAEQGTHHLEATAHRLLGSLACRGRHPCRPASEPSGDERAAAPDGADRARWTVQPRAAHLDGAVDGAARPALPARTMIGAEAPDAILLAGPTASGKSDWALHLAERVPAEIVSVDSAQVYRGFDIGSAKPSRALRRTLPHHLVDIREPEQAYSAGDFVEDALAAIAAIRGRGRLPLLVGGTMLYFRAFVHGMAALPRADFALRREIDQQAARLGWPALHAELAGLDPQSAARIHPNDAQRIQRALEVVRVSGRPISDWQRDTAPAHALRLQRWALVPADRERLGARIAQRFDQMIEAGFVCELRALQARPGLSAAAPSLRAVGYRQLWDHAAGREALPAAIERARAATRQLARRQLTWIRADPGWTCIDPFEPAARESWLQRVQDTLRQRRPDSG